MTLNNPQYTGTPALDTPSEPTVHPVITDRLAQLKALIPEAFSDDTLDVDALRAALGEQVASGPERYGFSFAGKRDARQALQTPAQGTLHPAPGEGLDEDTAPHAFIEGDNLEVLKLLYRSYAGAIKLIYIDPPYNTGNDFVYPDNFAEPLQQYLKMTGQADANGKLLTSATDRNGGGHRHSNWMRMMYPRLFMARQLLRDDGVIFISIDDNEVHNLRLLMNEIFGEENFLAQLVWDKTRKNDAKLFSVGHEYLVVYAKSQIDLRELKTVWREVRPGAKEIIEQYRALRNIHGNNNKAIEADLRTWYQSLPNNHPSKKLSRYKQVDKWGPWRDRDISWPGGDGPRYDVIHPKTKKPCKVPEAGWRFATRTEMERQIRLGLVEFREDDSEPPIRKAHLIPVPEELDDENVLDDGVNEDADEEVDDAVGLQVMPSYIYAQAQVAVKQLRQLMNGKIFDNPKDPAVIARLISYVTSSTQGDLVLDFFGGSGTTAHAVLDVNRQDGGNRRFIVVQLPEPTPEKSPARKAGYEFVSEIGKERIRRVIKRMRAANDGKLIKDSTGDLGFNVFKLVPGQRRV